MSINQVCIAGEITKEVKISTDDKGNSFCFINIKMTETYKDKSYDSYISCNFWGKVAEKASTLNIGDTIFISGKIGVKKNKDNTYGTIVKVTDFMIGGGGGKKNVVDNSSDDKRESKMSDDGIPF